MPATSSHLLIELAIGTLTVAGFGFIYFYWQKKKRQRSIEDEIKGTNRRRIKKALPPLPPAVVDDAVAAKNEGDLKLNDVDIEKDKKIQQKELLQENVDAAEILGIPYGMQERAVNLEIRISRDDVGSLIGKGGVNIRKIQRETNTRIIPRREERFENGDRMYTIIGLPDAVGLAESKIMKHIMSQPVLSTAEVFVPAHSLGRIIGRGGESIRSLQDVSLTRIDIPDVDSDAGKDFTSADYEFPKVTGNMRVIKIRGTEDQIAHAQKLISDLVEEDATLRERIEATVAARAPRRKLKAAKDESDGEKSESSVPSKHDLSHSLLRQYKTLEVFVSCVYHPNQFYIQIVSADVIKLDKLGKAMSQYYRLNPKDEEIETNFAVGDMCAVTFTDNNMYRGKILSLEADFADILYVDYGDISKLKISQLRKIRPDFLNLRFQAILATLNLESLEEKWSNEAIDEVVELTKCAKWDRMQAKVLGYLKDPSDCDTIWLDIYDKEDNNIADILIAKGLVACKEKRSTPSPTPPKIVANVSNSLSPVNTNTSSSENQNGIS